MPMKYGRFPVFFALLPIDKLKLSARVTWIKELLTHLPLNHQDFNLYKIVGTVLGKSHVPNFVSFSLQRLPNTSPRTKRQFVLIHANLFPRLRRRHSYAATA